jgi:DNA-binding NtrC family response regulator
VLVQSPPPAVTAPRRTRARREIALLLPEQLVSGHRSPLCFPPALQGGPAPSPLPTTLAHSIDVLRLSASFSALWDGLAHQLGVPCRQVDTVADFTTRPGCVQVIAAGGDEAGVEELLRRHGAVLEGVAVVGALDNHRVAVALMRAGAADYFALPHDLEALTSWMRDRLERADRAKQAAVFANQERSKYTFDGILGDSTALRAALERAARIIPRAGVTVLITGETGTGKELLARAIHYNGPRRDQPFVDINCAAIPEQLLESELFGHEKGAFTDASSSKPGLFEMADGGTLFLDEIGHLALPLQGKLLRALEERQIRRVGGTKLIPINVRVVAATHVNLAEASRRGTFREDLYYRLNVVPLELPALRDRRTDIVPLAEHFVQRFAADYDMDPPRLTASAHQVLRMHHWSGNIRELRNVIERAVLLCNGLRIDATDLSLDQFTTTSVKNGSLPFPATLAVLTRAAVEEMLRLTDGNKSEAARQLDISRPRLLRLLDDSSVSDSDPDSDTDHA